MPLMSMNCTMHACMHVQNEQRNGAQAQPSHKLVSRDRVAEREPRDVHRISWLEQAEQQPQ